tara:strand:- start:531 stop:791 length:261 start_codon:yes stop_codon:yes gene_type:complete
LERRPSFLETEYPFEWSGVYVLEKDRYQLSREDGPDPNMSLVVISDQAKDEASLKEGAEQCVRLYDQPSMDLNPGGEIPVGKHVNL